MWQWSRTHAGKPSIRGSRRSSIWLAEPWSRKDAESSKIISGYSPESPEKAEARRRQAPAGQVHVLGPGLLQCHVLRLRLSRIPDRMKPVLDFSALASLNLFPTFTVSLSGPTGNRLLVLAPEPWGEFYLNQNLKEPPVLPAPHITLA